MIQIPFPSLISVLTKPKAGNIKLRSLFLSLPCKRTYTYMKCLHMSHWIKSAFQWLQNSVTRIWLKTTRLLLYTSNIYLILSYPHLLPYSSIHRSGRDLRLMCSPGKEILSEKIQFVYQLKVFISKTYTKIHKNIFRQKVEWKLDVELSLI